jgi:predicted amidohydrolase YtcJ
MNGRRWLSTRLAVGDEEAMDPDHRPILIRGGSVFTATDAAPWAEALVIQGSRIVGVGPLDELAERFPGSSMLDVGGRTVLPGLIDAHNHFLATGESLSSVDARHPGTSSIDELVQSLSEVAGRTPIGEWISAFGFDDAKYERGLTRWDLDQASSSHPIRVHHVSGHHVFVNSVALDHRGVGEDTPDPQGGQLVRDASGRLTGLCLDAAMNLILPVAVDIGAHGPNFHTVTTVQESVGHVERAGRSYLEAGLTTVCDAQVSRRELVAYREARRQGKLGVRTVCMPLSHQLDEFLALGLAGPFGDDHLSLGAMKFYADGSLIGGTATFVEPYGEHGEFEGSMYWSPSELQEMIVAAHVGGWQVGVHVQGDRAMAAVLDALEEAVRAAPRDHRHRLEHAGYATPELIERIARLGAITVNQTNYLHDSGDEFLARLGERAHGLQPLRAELDAGITLVLSSDSDVTSYRPLDTIGSAIARRTAGSPSVHPSAHAREALRAHTISAAYALFMEDRIGSIEVGKLADVVGSTATSPAPPPMNPLPRHLAHLAPWSRRARRGSIPHPWADDEPRAHEQARLLVFQVAQLARRQQALGLRLNAPEAIAIACDEMHMAARAGGASTRWSRRASVRRA